MQTITNTTDVTNSSFAVHEVYFATTRNDTLKENLNTRFGKLRAPLTLGLNSVAIPADYPKANKASFIHWNVSLKRNPEKYVALVNIEPMQDRIFEQQLIESAAIAPDEPLLLFIHGYNTPFERAARITAKLNYDLGLNAPSLLFSWPSQERPSAYSADEENLAWSQPYLETFLTDVMSALPNRSFVLLAHSMGNRALVNALRNLPEEQSGQISHIVMAAPDIDADIFQRDLASDLTALNIPITLYISADDFALKASNRLYGYPRVGFAGEEIVVVDGIDTIDASDAESELLGHEYFSQGTHTVNDLYQWIMLNKPPEEREGLERVINDTGVYWRIAP